MKQPNLLSVLLTHLQVPFTPRYAARVFNEMSFRSLFGFTKLLESYGIRSQGYELASVNDCTSLPAPFVAGLDDGSYCVVCAISPAEVTVAYPDGSNATLAFTDFSAHATRKVLCAYPAPDAIEPNYRRHRVEEAGEAVKPWILAATLVFIFSYLVISEGVTHSVWTIILTLLDLAGIYVSYLLILKQLHIHSATAERVCGIIQEHGCSRVLASSASSVMGLFHWAEVGMAYFGVTLVVQIAIPAAWHMLAAANLCCLPFSVWSVWYQRTKAKAWCTLCLTVQSIFWLQFLCYLAGGFVSAVWPLSSGILLLGAVYLAALLIINRVTSYFGPTE